ncbi:MAG: N-acetylmuramoyl-L-alanine amidase [Cytophagales bacterium]|nr:N-acetylmuramoyl-L-alanine amidase [Bernardetiaceae bacterium]MDW8203971.1 N-acetylmuramoyl-L-alanine amidase [Cytophagales bacterium]
MLIILLCASEAYSQLTIIQRPLPEKCSRPREKEQPVTHLMIHFCSICTQQPENPYDLNGICQVFEKYGVSAHYLIGRDGTVYQLVDESRIAYHAGKGKLPFPPYLENSFNRCSIGIELMGIGTQEEMAHFMSAADYQRIAPSDIGFTEAQYVSLQQLIADICKRHPQVKQNRQHIVGHHEYAPDRKVDPGSLFNWKKIGL